MQARVEDQGELLGLAVDFPPRGHHRPVAPVRLVVMEVVTRRVHLLWGEREPDRCVDRSARPKPDHEPW
jgi:hypothetical protein